MIQYSSGVTLIQIGEKRKEPPHKIAERRQLTLSVASMLVRKELVDDSIKQVAAGYIMNRSTVWLYDAVPEAKKAEFAEQLCEIDASHSGIALNSRQYTDGMALGRHALQLSESRIPPFRQCNTRPDDIIAQLRN